jgi:nicotinate-nucleotide pyrophosphorylase (carboxylating)
MHWDASQTVALIRAALDEDLRGPDDAGRTDLTTEAAVAPGAQATARLVARQELVLAGLPLAERVFSTLDAGVLFRAQFAEGARVPRGAEVARMEGCARPILSAERTALNFLGRLSGIATLTRRFVDAAAGSDVRIRDTRKTTPGLRALEKYAVHLGGGVNHRAGLYDAILIKENHVAAAGGIAEALRRAREHAAHLRTAGGAEVPIQIEVRNETEMGEALAAGATCLLLDNQPPEEARRLIQVARAAAPGCVIEVSGGVTLANVRAYAEAGPDFISIGALTHSAPAADFSLLVDAV